MIEKIDPAKNVIKSSDIKDKNVWTTLITNTKYLTGLLTLDYSLKRVGSKYPLVALYTDGLSEEGHRVLDDRGIFKLKIEYLMPTQEKDYSNDPRFYDCWSKLQPFSLIQFDKVVQLDSDMVVLQNMDELFDIELNDTDKAFAASHACVCNPYKYEHYPKDWVKENCAFTNYHKKLTEGENHDVFGPRPSEKPLGICNGGLQVVKPSQKLYDKIVQALSNEEIMNYDFADQSLLSDVFKSNWVAISYVYNYLKTLRIIHQDLDFARVKNIHYIITPKPWDVEPKDRLKFKDETKTFQYWWEIDDERLQTEQKKGINDGY